ncbi:hypothetical protein [Corynebacterium sp. NML180780]|uniref:hypothetical protein n=1 Tax=Corynebacterium sp. NML180780 TaxID=2598459 RepID=UPI0011949055|nr:hypothetical protein [Corynebacterium sp. NML180780]TVX76465.1 hypothetical protein FPP74_11135 [Corynebacterium sp. NML180780]
MKKTIVALAAASAMFLASCSGTETASSQSQETARAGYEIGDFVLNVIDVADPSNVAEVVMPEYESFKQVSVTADVTNNSAEAVDLACSKDLEVQIASNGSALGNAGYLERVPGNPQCGDMLAPGETKQMTWVSLTPEEAQPTDLFVQLASDPSFFEEIPLR